MSVRPRHFYDFGPFRLDVSERLLLHNGASITLPPKAFETLLVLVENAGHLLEKEDFMKRLWPDTFVEEANLANNISLLRKVLGADSEGRQYIETVPKRGYRFVGEVKVSTAEALKSQPGALPELNAGDSGANIATPANITPRRRTLRWTALIAIGMLIASTTYLAFHRRTVSAPPASLSVRSIAVLPFKPLVEASRDEVLELGVADTLITRISNIRQINVRPTSAVRRYANLANDPIAAGREQRVDAVLDGNIQKTGDKIRVSVRLVRVADEATLWAAQFDEQYTDIFAVQDAIAKRVGEVLIAKLTGEEINALAKDYTQNVEAYQLYLKGRYFWGKFTEDDLKKSIEYFNHAIEKDPNYTLAYLGLANSYVVLGVNFRPPKEVMPRAKAYVAKALELDKTLADAYGSQGGIKYFFEWDWPGAEKEFLRAMEFNTSEAASAHELHGYYLWTMVRLEDAINEMKRAQELDPLSVVINEDLGVAYYYARQYDKAIAQQEETLALNPNHFFSYVRMGQAYQQKEMYKEAIAELSKAQTISGNWPGAVAELGCAYALAGQKGEARKVLAQLQQRASHEYIDPYLIALIYVSLNEKDQSFEWLGKAYEARSPWLTWLKAEPKFDRLRSDPRFTELMKMVGLPT